MCNIYLDYAYCLSLFGNSLEAQYEASDASFPTFRCAAEAATLVSSKETFHCAAAAAPLVPSKGTFRCAAAAAPLVSSKGSILSS